MPYLSAMKFDNDVKSPNCEIYKAIFPEVLRLEGLLLIINPLLEVVLGYYFGESTDILALT